MAEYNDGERIKKMFLTDTVNEQGVYAVRMYKSGYELEVVVDDQICCKHSNPYFAHPKKYELWVPLVEKAWAKTRGNFSRTIGGLGNQAMSDLTGAPSKCYRVPNFDDIFDRIKRAVDKNFMITTVPSS